MSSKEIATVGVVVGRFQVHKLHAGHLDLLSAVQKKHSRILVFLGVPAGVPTRRNPLPFEARKQMLLQAYPDFTVLPIPDMRSDEVWSTKLDRRIREIYQVETIQLYGGRHSFLKHYSGIFPVAELESTIYSSSGTAVRDELARRMSGSEEFRAGIVWAVYNQFPRGFLAVDVAVLGHPGNGPLQVLLVRKPHEEYFRFPGGFYDPVRDRSPEDTGAREIFEECGIRISRPLSYISSQVIDDWRYRGEKDKIVSIFFEGGFSYENTLQPGDDVIELKWVVLEDLYNEMLMFEHESLKVALLLKYGIQKKTPLRYQDPETGSLIEELPVTEKDEPRELDFTIGQL